VDAGHLPGALTLIWRRGALAHSSLVGQMDMGRSIPMRVDTIFIAVFFRGARLIGVAVTASTDAGRGYRSQEAEPPLGPTQPRG